MVLPAKERAGRQSFDTRCWRFPAIEKERPMTYVSTVKTQEQAFNNIKAGLRTLKTHDESRTRIMSALAISLADAMSFATEQGFAACTEMLRDVVKTVVARNEKNEPDAGETRKLMSSAGDAVKAAMLLLDAKSGVIAGFRRNDGREYISAEQFAGMNKQQADRHSPELFWNRAATFPKQKIGQDVVTSANDLVIPTQENIRDAYKVHFGNAEIMDGYKIKPAARPEGEGINSHSDAKRQMAFLTAWINDGNLLVLDDKSASQYQKLADTIAKGLLERDNANSQTDELEAVA
jgi:hypothetical protein